MIRTYNDAEAILNLAAKIQIKNEEMEKIAAIEKDIEKLSNKMPKDDYELAVKISEIQAALAHNKDDWWNK